MSMLQLNDELLRELEDRDVEDVVQLDHSVEISRLQHEVLRLREQIKRLGVYRFMAYRDDLTGLHNRRYFDEHLRDECARVERFTDYQFALIIVDINDFKRVNDTYGHAAGDELLCETARLLTETLRRVDMCCRLGGDEFGLILPETDEHGAKLMIARLNERLAKYTSHRPYRLSISLGYACPWSNSPDPTNILCKADEAMYAAKRRHKKNMK